MALSKALFHNMAMVCLLKGDDRCIERPDRVRLLFIFWWLAENCFESEEELLSEVCEKIRRANRQQPCAQGYFTAKSIAGRNFFRSQFYSREGLQDCLHFGAGFEASFSCTVEGMVFCSLIWRFFQTAGNGDAALNCGIRCRQRTRLWRQIFLRNLVCF